MANIRYNIEVDDVEFATLIAALRMWQWILESGTQMPKVDTQRIRDVIVIANKNFSCQPLQAEQIGMLIARLVIDS